MASNNSSVHFDLKTHATDFVPDAVTRDALRRLIHQQDEELKDLDDEISQLRVPPRVLKEQRAELAKSHLLHRAFLGPIRKLAPEILGEVFIQLASQRPLYCRFISDWLISDVRLPLLLVCQRWKRIAMGTPRLWTFSRINPAPWSVDKRPQIGLQICLDNSGCLPIQVELAHYNFEGSVEIRHLLNNFHRVGKFQGYGSPLMQEILRRGIILQTPLLKVVRLLGYDSAVSQDEPRHKDIIQAPPIEFLELNNCPSLFSVFCRKPGMLQHLTVKGSSVSDRYTPALLDILPFLSSLRSLDLRLPRNMIAIRKDVQRISLPHLRSLRVHGRLKHVYRLLAVLDVQSLDRLVLRSGSRYPVATSWILIQSFLQGDPPPLRYLTLQCTLLGPGFVEFISRLSHLEHLLLNTCGIKAEHLEPFILDSHIPHDNMVCPRLATLSIFAATFPEETLVQVLQSRVPLAGTPWENRCLRYVNIWSCSQGAGYWHALGDIDKACEGNLTLELESYGCSSRCTGTCAR